jgi:hypothetical protein
MTTFSPMLACGPSLDFGPVGNSMIGITIALWFVSAAVAIPNLIMIWRAGQSEASKCGNLAFFIGYAGSSLALWTGLMARTLPEIIGLAAMIILFFFGPGMVIGHFCYLLFTLARDRRARKLRDLSAVNGMAELEGAK